MTLAINQRTARKSLPEINCPLLAAADAVVDMTSRAETALFYYLQTRGRHWTHWVSVVDALDPFTYDELIAASDQLAEMGSIEEFLAQTGRRPDDGPDDEGPYLRALR